MAYLPKDVPVFFQCWYFVLANMKDYWLHKKKYTKTVFTSLYDQGIYQSEAFHTENSTASNSQPYQNQGEQEEIKKTTYLSGMDETEYEHER